MKKRILFLLIAAMLALTACSREETPAPTRTEPTLPSFQEELPPLEQLTAAIEKTRSAGSMEIAYTQQHQSADGSLDSSYTGCFSRYDDGSYTALRTTADGREAWFDGGIVYERMGDSCYTCVSEKTFTPDQIFSDVVATIGNDHFLEDFCSRKLSAIPSNNGSICYQVTDLTTEEFYALVYGQSKEVPETEDAQTVDAVITMVIDAQGYLTDITFALEILSTDGEPVFSETSTITLTQIGEAIEILPPDWAEDPNLTVIEAPYPFVDDPTE